MKHYTKSKNLTSKKHSKTMKTGYAKRRTCKKGCRTQDCGHTPYLYGGNGPNQFQKLDDLGQNLAYTGKPVAAVSPNPHLAYTGKGGFGGKVNLAKAYPIVNNQIIPGNSTVNWLNSNTMSGGKKKMKGRKWKGGSCGCSNNNAYGHLAYIPGQKGGCGQCVSYSRQNGGSSFYKNPLPYPNGLVGTAWKPDIASWPGVNGVSGDSNYYPLNTYSPVDISRQMIATGAAKPFVSGGGRKGRMTRKKRGGTIYAGQDFLNLGRQFLYNGNNAYNALRGVPAPTNPMPWKDQFVQV